MAPRAWRRRTAAAALLALGGCGGPQSALDPAGIAAREIGGLALVMVIGAAVIFLLVIGFALYATRVEPGRHPRFSGQAFILLGGVVLPVVVLGSLLTYSLLLGPRLTRAVAGDALRIEVVGHQWWWEVRYLVPGAAPVISANEVRIPAGESVEVLLLAADVIHSFWVPRLAGKIDMIPGRRNRLVLQADVPGVYRAQCAEYCGGPHALMALEVIALTADEFAAWIAREAEPAAIPLGPRLTRGRDLFIDSGCGACHRVRGTSADGTFGPDLTHLGSRRTLGAGILPNNVSTIAGWIAGNQEIKPGNRMPAFNTFDGAALTDLAAWLGSLE